MRITPFMRAYRKRILPRRLPKNRRVSPHFRDTEFWTKDGTPIPIKSLPGLKSHCARFLEPLRAKFGACHVMSGYRHEAYNRRIGGATDSQHDWDKHPTGCATDLIFATGTPEEWGREAKKIADKLGFGGVGIYVRSGFIHVDSRAYRANWRG